MMLPGCFNFSLYILLESTRVMKSIWKYLFSDADPLPSPDPPSLEQGCYWISEIKLYITQQVARWLLL